MKKEIIWSCNGFFVEDNIIWFSPYYYDFLCGYDLRKDSLTFKHVFEDSGCKKDGYINVIKSKNNVLLVPAYASSIHLLDISIGNSIDWSVKSKNGASFFQAKYFNGRFILFPFADDRIIEVDTRNDIPIFSDISCDFNGFVSSVLYERAVYLVRGDNRIFEYNTENRKLIIKTETNTDNSFVDIIPMTGSIMLLLDSKGYLYRWDQKNNDIVQQARLEEEYFSMAYRGGCVYLFPKNKADRIDLLSFKEPEKIEHIDVKLQPTDQLQGWKAQMYSKSVVCDDRVFVMNILGQVLLEIDVDDKVKYHRIEFPKLEFDEKKLIYRNEMRDDNVIAESQIGIDLPFFLSFIADSESPSVQTRL